jgi:hypothetical protein
MPVVIFAAPYFADTAKRFIEAPVNLPEVQVGLISIEGTLQFNQKEDSI